MLTLPPCVRIFLCAEQVDLRLGHDGLAARVRQHWGDALFDGHLFVFLGKRLDRCKVLFWDRGGFVLYYKKLDQGLFEVPRALRPGQSSVVLSDAAFEALFSGISLRVTH